jgi:3-phenylpropionate/trans-cinnamate dioxygenase ferredoxin subunit
MSSTTTAKFVKVARVGEILPGQSKLVEIDDVRIALFNLEGAYYAIEDTCTHDGGPLVEGTIVNGCEVKCPRHGARFDIRTGAALSLPAIRPTNVYAVQVNGSDILVQSPE